VIPEAYYSLPKHRSRLYQLRKRHQKDRLLLGQLDAAEERLFSNDLAGAKELLDQVEAKRQAAAESKQ
jgi:hypothetical protein